jgi:hypothetical protein
VPCARSRRSTPKLLGGAMPLPTTGCCSPAPAARWWTGDDWRLVWWLVGGGRGSDPDSGHPVQLLLRPQVTADHSNQEIRSASALFIDFFLYHILGTAAIDLIHPSWIGRLPALLPSSEVV